MKAASPTPSGCTWSRDRLIDSPVRVVESIDLTLDDIRHHAGLVLNHRHETGSQIVVWVE